MLIYTIIIKNYFSFCNALLPAIDRCLVNFIAFKLLNLSRQRIFKLSVR